MIELHADWIELAILCPLLGALWVRRLRNPDVVRLRSLIVCGVTLLLAVAAWWDFRTIHPLEAHDRWDLFSALFGESAFVIDFLSAPLLPLAALLYLITALATLRTKVRRFSFTGMLVSEAILLATLSSKQPSVVTTLLIAGIVPPWIELKSRHKPTRVYLSHMALFVVLLLCGQALVTFGSQVTTGYVGVALVTLAVLIRSGIAPLHCWLTDLFENASFGTSLLFVTPMVGAYGAARLVLPIAPDALLQAMAILSVLTALYAAGMAIVQREARRFFCYIFLSHSSLVFVGLAVATPISLTGALCVWLSVGLSMAGFGLTLRSVEARTGRLSLDKFHGLYEHTPGLATLFLITGLASIGFPGTVGFVGAELLVDGVVHVDPLVGIAIVIAAALNGLAVLQAYFRVFTGTRHASTVDLGIRLPERIAVLVLTALILGGGLYPQPGVASRYEVAQHLIVERARRLGEPRRVEVDRSNSQLESRLATQTEH